MSKKYNTYILNNYWTHDNFGAVLTAYALQNIINPEYNPVLLDTTDYFYLLQTKKNEYINNFKRNNLRYISKVFNDRKSFDDNSIFITGSDQVFRTHGDYRYMLDFAICNQKKIAFSASFGVNKEQFLKENSEEIIEHMKLSLKSFDFISVREKSGVSICKEILGVDAEWIIDPVFIFDKSKYNELILDANKEILRSTQNNKKIYKNKIVAYVLDTNKEYKKAYKYLSKKYNKKVIETANSNVSVENWLASIRDCDLFITDSFHGMCFALIFNKPFICLANKDRGITRFDSICEMLGIEYQCIDSITDVLQKDCVFKVNYEGVNERIKRERQRGLEFLQKALEVPVTKTQEKINSRMQFLENRVCELEEQNTLSYQLKKYLWEKWRVIYYCYLPKSIKSIIGFIWHVIKGVK